MGVKLRIGANAQVKEIQAPVNFNKYLSRTYDVLGTFKVLGDSSEYKKQRPTLMALVFRWAQWEGQSCSDLCQLAYLDTRPAEGLPTADTPTRIPSLKSVFTRSFGK